MRTLDLFTRAWNRWYGSGPRPIDYTAVVAIDDLRALTAAPTAMAFSASSSAAAAAAAPSGMRLSALGDVVIQILGMVVRPDGTTAVNWRCGVGTLGPIWGELNIGSQSFLCPLQHQSPSGLLAAGSLSLPYQTPAPRNEPQLVAGATYAPTESRAQVNNANAAGAVSLTITSFGHTLFFAGVRPCTGDVASGGVATDRLFSFDPIPWFPITLWPGQSFYAVSSANNVNFNYSIWWREIPTALVQAKTGGV